MRDDLKEHKKQRLAAGVATVDCTLDTNKKLCAAQQIQAFPSLRLYRAGESYGVKQPNASSKGKAAGKGQLQFEAYHGDRSAEAIAAYVHEALDETLHEADAKHESSYDDDEGKARAASATKKAAVAAGARKALGGTARASGCVIDGSVRVNRVPGALYVTPHSIGHAINSELVNMTHVIKHLSFGKHGTCQLHTSQVPCLLIQHTHTSRLTFFFPNHKSPAASPVSCRSSFGTRGGGFPGTWEAGSQARTCRLAFKTRL